MDKQTAAMLNAAYKRMLKNLGDVDSCEPTHRRYKRPSVEHPGWVLVGCDDCNIHFSVAEEQVAAWEAMPIQKRFNMKRSIIEEIN